MPVYTGARRAEMVALRWEDISEEDMIVKIRRSKGDKEGATTIFHGRSGTMDTLTDPRECQGGK